MKRIAKQRIVYDNYDMWDIHHDAAIEYLMDGENEDEITESDIWDEIYCLDEMWYDEELEELERFFHGGTYIIFGGIGRWDGVRSGFDVSDDFAKLYRDAVKDCEYIRIYDENGHFHIVCSHHDGTNHYEIKKLTDAGIRYLDNWYYSSNDKRTNSYVFDKLVKRYSTLPRFAEMEWGCKRVEYEPLTKEGIINRLNNDARSFYC